MVKKKGASNKEEETAVLEYMTKTNRPYSATDIFNNLHQKYTKASITKTLEKLVQDESLFSKIYGKTTIYSIKQKSLSATIEGEEQQEGESSISSNSQCMDSISKNLDELTTKYEELVNKNKKLDQFLNELQSELTTSGAKKMLEKVQQDNVVLQERLNQLKNGTTLISPEKRKRTNQEYDTNRALWKKRKGMFKNIFGTITEHHTGDLKKFKEDLGIEDDEVPFDQDPVATFNRNAA